MATIFGDVVTAGLLSAGITAPVVVACSGLGLRATEQHHKHGNQQSVQQGFHFHGRFSFGS
jgi:hypothetical protein